MKRRTSTPLSRRGTTQRKLWHSTTGHYYSLLLSCPSAHLYTRSLSHFLPLPRSFLAPRARFSSSSLSFFGENFPVESLRRHGDGIESFSSCCSGGGGIPKHERADAFELGERERKRERREKKIERRGGKREPTANSPSFDYTRAIVCNSARKSNRNSPLSWLCSIVPVCIDASLFSIASSSTTNCHRDCRSMEIKSRDST